MKCLWFSSICCVAIISQGVVFADDVSCSKYDFEEKVLEKLIRMEFEEERMKSEFEECKNKVELLDNEVKGAVNELKQRIATLESDKQATEKVSQESADLGESFALLEQKVINTLESAVQQLNQKLTELKPTPIVAFSATNPAIPRKGETIIFNTPMQNYGEGYNEKTGIFTAPVSGVYLFTTQICINSGGRYIFYAIMHNNSLAAQKSLINDSSSNFCTSADATIVMLVGEIVTVKCTDLSSLGDRFSETDKTWNTFSGVLLHAHPRDSINYLL